jgi:hypothetical protein
MIIDITERYVSAFGNNVVSGNLRKYSSANTQIYGFETYMPDASDFEDVTIKYDDKVLKFGYEILYNGGTLRNNIKVSPSEKVIFAPPLICGFSREKNLIITPLNGDGMEVVERWNNAPWDINIQGILIDANEHHYPTEKIERLRKLFDYNNVLEVSGQQFYEKGIDFMYVKSINIEGVEGFPDTVKFSLSARSIRDIGFKMNE